MKKSTKLWLIASLSLSATMMMSSCDTTGMKDGFGGFVDSSISSILGEDASNAIKDGFNGIVDTIGGWFGAEPENPEVKVTVTFDSDGGSAIESKEFTVGEAYDLSTLTPTKAGYTFGGWYNGETAVGNTGTWTIAENVTFKAKWTAIQYEITYVGMDGVENANPVVYTVEDEDITLVNPTKVGYTFNGWTEDGEAIAVIDTERMEALELTANWTAKTYTLTVINGSSSTDYTVTYNQAYTLVTPEDDSYTFAGWYDENGNSFTKTDVWTIDDDVTLTAHWVAGIAFDFNGAKNAVQDYALELDEGDSWDWSNDTNINNPQKDGYTFKGWYVGGDEVALTGESWTYGNVTLTAEWEAISYTITYADTKDQANTNPASYTVETADFTLVALADVTGYEFAGWELNGQTVTVIDTATAKNITLTAKWNPIEYEIEIKIVGVKDTTKIKGLTSIPKTYTIETEINLSNWNLSYEGNYWDFNGYYDAEEDGNKVTKIEKGTTGNIVLYAYFSESMTVGWTGFY